MEQLRDYADERLLLGCIYCGAQDNTREHVPSRVLLDKPYPENLPVVGACHPCNNGFSKDEEYVACLIESVIAGSTEPEKIRRQTIATLRERSPLYGRALKHLRLAMATKSYLKLSTIEYVAFF